MPCGMEISMKKANLSALAKSVRTGMKKHTPEILTGLGIVGMVTTTVMAVKATPKALILIEEKKKQTGSDLVPMEMVKVSYKCYIPAAITGMASVACLIGASSVNARRNAALAAAYTLSEATLKEYQGKVIETIGEKKEKSVRDAIAKDKLAEDPVTNREVLITGKGKSLCYDAVSGRYFECDIDLIKKAEAKLNIRIRDEMYVSLNDFYYEIGLPDIKLGENLGWNINDGYIELDFSSQLAEDGRPCLVIDYHIAPRYDYCSNW